MGGIHQIDWDRFAAYVEAMMAVEKAKVKTKSEADKILHTVEPVSPMF